MLLSMTGFGAAEGENEFCRVSVEMRGVNNRYLKISTRCPDRYPGLEGRIEKLIRETVSRGTINVAVRIQPLLVEPGYSLDGELLKSLWRELEGLTEELPIKNLENLGPLLALPGVVVEREHKGLAEQTAWTALEPVLREAIDRFRQFRLEDGSAIEADLLAQCEAIGRQLSRVIELAPQVVTGYRDRLHDRVQELLKEHDVTVDDSHLIREVSLFADRCDINEEIKRLQCHLEQFTASLQEESSAGRKLEFISQEIFREVNTVGSKANNVEIAHCVVEMKACVEKIRENLQNVE